MNSLPHPNNLHLQAVEGWLGLGNWKEANEELEKITPQLRAHPTVLEVRYKIYSAAGKWEMAVEVARGIQKMVPENPSSYLHLAYAFHELNQIKEAYETLQPIVDKFPSEWLVRYNLACYSCVLGKLEESMDWLEKAIDLADKKDIRLMALEDKDLEALWSKIGEI